ncbi:TPA: hypothetical protein DCX15_02105 [bacterium]|nr:hypothetical protein [bacterium]
MRINADLNLQFQPEHKGKAASQKESGRPEMETTQEEVRDRIRDSGTALEKMEWIATQIFLQPNLAMLVHSNIDSTRAMALVE